MRGIPTKSTSTSFGCGSLTLSICRFGGMTMRPLAPQMALKVLMIRMQFFSQSLRGGHVWSSGGGQTRDALEGKGPQRRPQQRLHRRLEEAAKTVQDGYCRLQMPLKLALAVRETVAGHRLGALEEAEGAGGTSSVPMRPWGGGAQ